MSLPTLRDVISWMFPGCFFWKVDWKKGFWQIPIRKSDQRLFGYKWKGEFFCWQVVCFGWAPAPAWFSRFSYTLRDWCCAWDMVVWTYIDDTLGVSCSETDADFEQSAYLHRLAEWGFTENAEKRVLPSQIGEWLGFELDSLRMEVRVSQAKRDEILARAVTLMSASSAQVGDLQKFAGKLSWLVQAVRGGFAYMRRI